MTVTPPVERGMPYTDKRCLLIETPKKEATTPKNTANPIWLRIDFAYSLAMRGGTTKKLKTKTTPIALKAPIEVIESKKMIK